VKLTTGTLPFALAAFALAACSPAPQTPSAAGATPDAAAESAEGETGHGAVLLPQMVCGPDAFIKPDTTRAALVEMHGAENVTEETLPWADSEEKAVVLFAKDPAMRTELFWLGETTGGPAYVSVSGEETQFIGPKGLIMGATLEDVEAANGGPFMLMGFENHNSGEAGDWLGGALATPDGGTCFQRLTFDLPADVAPDVAAKVSGDPEKVYRSDSPEMRAAKPVVVSMAIAYAKDPS